MNLRHLALSAALLAIGCTHAKTTDQETATPAKENGKENAQDKGEQKAKTAEAHGGKPHARAPHRDPSAVPVASSAGALLEPGAERQIRDKLVARGFMETPADGASPPSLRAPLQRFQDANDLPATGTPDAETLRKLGLDPNAVLRKASSQGTDSAGGDRSDASDRRRGGAPE